MALLVVYYFMFVVASILAGLLVFNVFYWFMCWVFLMVDEITS